MTQFFDVSLFSLLGRCRHFKDSINALKKILGIFTNTLFIRHLSAFENHIKTLSDNELVLLYKAEKNSLYIGYLFERYSHLIMGVCLKYLKDKDEASDAVMHVFEKLMSDLHKHEVSNFKSWLYTVAKNHCLMSLRSKKSSLKQEVELKKDASLFMETGWVLHQDNAMEKERTLNALNDCLEQLNDDQKKAISLFYLNELCYSDVAEQTGYSKNEVKSFIQNGKRNLKNCMDKKL